MTEESANIEWEQKKGIDHQTRASRRIDVKKVLAAEMQDRKSFKNKTTSIKKLSPNLHKIRNKIRDIYDEDEEDEDDGIVFNFSLDNGTSSLYDALKEDEKASLQIKKAQEDQKLQQTAGKMEAVMLADKMSKKLGLKGIKKKIINNNVQDVSLSSETFNNVLKQNIAEKTKIKTDNLSSKDTTEMVKGLKKFKQAALTEDIIEASSINHLKAEDLVKISKTKDSKETAEMILEKSGRKEIKKQPSVNKNKKKQQTKDSLRQANIR